MRRGPRSGQVFLKENSQRLPAPDTPLAAMLMPSRSMIPDPLLLETKALLPEHVFRSARDGVLGEAMFRWRGGDVSRIEGLSDGVFALALALLIVASSVPRTFSELSRSVREFPVFALCFWLLVMLWHYHYRFFRRYGLEDFITISLNGVLLLGVLFFVYPLKFLFTALLSRPLGLPRSLPDPSGRLVPILTKQDVPDMMAIDSWGHVGIWAVFALLTLHAWQLRDQLELNEAETFITLASLRAHLLSLSVGVLSLVILYSGAVDLSWSGWVYLLMGPIQGIHGYLSGRKLRSFALPNGST